MENKELNLKIEEKLNKIKEMILKKESNEKIKEEQRILNKLLKEYLKEE